jgi:heme-degrading monooxygenase HmoA
MFARILEFFPLMEKKDEFIRVLKKLLPILKKQQGFLEFLPLVPKIKTEKVLAVTLWTVVPESGADPETLFNQSLGAQALHAGDHALRALRKDTDCLKWPRAIGPEQ